jgi:hypothetical protein
MACCLFAAWLFGLAIRGLRKIHLLPQPRASVAPRPRVAGPSGQAAWGFSSTSATPWPEPTQTPRTP